MWERGEKQIKTNQKQIEVAAAAESVLLSKFNKPSTKAPSCSYRDQENKPKTIIEFLLVYLL